MPCRNTTVVILDLDTPHYPFHLTAFHLGWPVRPWEIPEGGYTSSLKRLTHMEIYCGTISVSLPYAECLCCSCTPCLPRHPDPDSKIILFSVCFLFLRSYHYHAMHDMTRSESVFVWQVSLSRTSSYRFCTVLRCR